MDGKKETIRLLGAVLILLCIGLPVCPGFAVVYIPGDETVGTWDPNERVYTLETDVWNNIEINEPNLILDGNGFSVINPGVGTGVGVDPSGNTAVTISNLTITGFTKGVYMHNCSGCILAQNILRNNGTGVYMWASNGNELIGNTMTEDSSGIYLYDSDENNIEANNINSYTSDGIKLYRYCELNTVTDNTIEGTIEATAQNGIFLNLYCHNNNITYNTISNSKYGISLLTSNRYNNLTDNLITSNSFCGIRLGQCSSNIITHNVISNHDEAYAKGLYVYDGSQGNQIYNNSFIDNYIQAEATSGPNIYNLDWQEGGGNYWSDWTEPDILEPFGFVDDPRIGMGIADYYPLVTPYLAPMSRQITSFYDTCVEDGMIVATEGKGRPPEKRLGVVRDLLVSAQALVEVGDFSSACQKLDRVLDMCDGIDTPPDLITGDGLTELIEMLLDLKVLLGC